jgi:hypothetical protein
MAKPTKHIGRMKNTGAKVLVVFRTLPGESDSALILPVNQLSDVYHDALMQLVETEQAQDAFELGEIMFIRHFPDGRPMLTAMQQDGRLQKLSTDMIIMTPMVNSTVPLDQLNILIAEQKNCAVDDLCTFVKGGSANTVPSKKSETVKESVETAAPVRAQAPANAVLTDTDIARSYRSQADAMYKEAARLRKEADALDPPKKKATAKVSEDASA